MSSTKPAEGWTLKLGALSLLFANLESSIPLSRVRAKAMRMTRV